MKTNKFWIILIIVLFVVFSVISVFIFIYHGVGNTVSIYQDGSLIKTINLDTVTTPYRFTVETKDGGYNEISVERGRISVSDASCPDHVCINTGWISDGVVPIVCLPNKLVIQASGDTGVDVAVQ